MMDLDEAGALLDAPAIPFDRASAPAALAEALAPRLQALLAVHGLEPTVDGWRMLALRLAGGHVAALRLEEPARARRGGRPCITDHAMLYARLARLRASMAESGRQPTNIAVARAYVAKRRKRRGGPVLPSLKVMQTVLTEGDAGRLSGNPAFAFLALDPIRDAAMEHAARLAASRN